MRSASDAFKQPNSYLLKEVKVFSKDSNSKLQSESNTFIPIELPTTSRNIHPQRNQVCQCDKDQKNQSKRFPSKSLRNHPKPCKVCLLNKTKAQFGNSSQVDSQQTQVHNAQKYSVETIQMTSEPILTQSSLKDINPFVVAIDLENLNCAESFEANGDSFSHSKNIDSRDSLNPKLTYQTETERGNSKLPLCFSSKGNTSNQ